ncbi:hypothetical protein [Streptomyces olivaceoviridis]|uniref:hypothetical protein n=1 Tax=Streptomyces olivaceoviridis TaxID=1921 RepID=UPI0036F53718
MSGDDDLSVPVGLAEPAAHLRVQDFEGALARRAAVEGDRGRVADLPVRLDTGFPARDVLSGHDDVAGDAHREQERGDPYQVGAHRRCPGGEFALQRAQQPGLRGELERDRVHGEGDETEDGGEAQGDEAEHADPGQSVVEAEQHQGQGGHPAEGRRPEGGQLPQVPQQYLPERPALEALHPVSLGAEHDAGARHRHDGEGDDEEGAEQGAVGVGRGQLPERVGPVGRCLEPEAGERADQFVDVPVRAEHVVVAARIAVAQLGDGVHIGAVVAVEGGVTLAQPVGVGASGGQVEMPPAVRLFEVGGLARDRRPVGLGELGHDTGDLRPGGLSLGVRHPDDGGVPHDPASVEVSEEQEGEHCGERQYGGVNELDTSVQHRRPRSGSAAPGGQNRRGVDRPRET